MYVTLDHKTSIKSSANICSNIQKIHCMGQNYRFFMPKIIGTLSKDHVPWRHSDSRFSNSCISAKYCPILTNHTSMESLFTQFKYKKYDWFCGPGSFKSCIRGQPRRLTVKLWECTSMASNYINRAILKTTVSYFNFMQSLNDPIWLSRDQRTPLK